MKSFKKAIRKIYHKIMVLCHLESKENVELSFWRNEIKAYMKWYSGELTSLYSESNPTEKDKIHTQSLKDSAILTWHKMHQETKYLDDLMLDRKAFADMKVLDIGSGPMPSGTVFGDCDLYCLDPLMAGYIKIGFPIHYYQNTKFISGPSENIPIANHYFDAIISVNAIDHVNDFLKTAEEIRRTLKPGGKLRMHVHYHKKTATEPLEINDEKMNEAFGWCQNFRKINESKTKRGYALNKKDELYTVWSN